MASIQNPYYVYVNSRNRLAGTDSTFTYNIAFPQDYEFDRVTVLDALIPKSYYLIQAGYNTFILEEKGVNTTITVPIGSYTLTSFKSNISNLLTAGSPNNWTYALTYPAASAPDTGKWTYTVTGNGGSQPSLIFNATLFEPFGFLMNSTNTFVGSTLISTAVIKLQAEDRILLHSNCVQNPGNDDILLSIDSSTSLNYASITYTNYSPEYNTKVLSSKHNNVYSFTLTDENGIVLDLNGLNLNFTLLFYKKDAIHDQIREFLKLLLETIEHKK